MGKIRVATGLLAVFLGGCQGARLLDDASATRDDRIGLRTRMVLVDDVLTEDEASAYAGSRMAPPPAGPPPLPFAPGSDFPPPPPMPPPGPVVAAPCAPPRAAEVDRAIGSHHWVEACPPPCPPAPCCPPKKEQKRCCGNGYVGVAFYALPGLGFGVNGGWIFSRNCTANLALEVGMNYQDLWTGINDNEDFTGKLFGANVGVKASFLPEARHHPVLRAGLGWRFQSENNRTSDVGLVDLKGEYYGGYVGVGYEFDLGCNGCWTTGPSADFWAGVRPSGSGWGRTLTLGWHLIRNF
jgi:hypothetical protein